MNAVKERPILFQGAMVRALLAGTKMQTRRAVKPQPFPDRLHRSVDSPSDSCIPGEHTWWSGNHTQGIYHTARCPYGQPGDRLWVRENGWERPDAQKDRDWPYAYDSDAPFGIGPFNEAYRAEGWKRRPSIHMPRWASRILLEVTDVRVERLQDISEADAIAEGITGPHDVGYPAYRVPDDSKPRYSRAAAAYEALWDQINGAGAWDANPWVWAVSFKRIEGAAS